MGCLSFVLLAIHVWLAFRFMAEAQFNGWIVALNIVLFVALFLLWGWFFDRRRYRRDVRRSQYWQNVHADARTRNNYNR